mgnify:CR=1 FL=1
MVRSAYLAILVSVFIVSIAASDSLKWDATHRTLRSDKINVRFPYRGSGIIFWHGDEPETEFRLDVVEIKEFLDENHNNVFDSGDVACSMVKFSGASWNVNANRVYHQGVHGYEVIISTELEVRRGQSIGYGGRRDFARIRLSNYVFEENVTFNGEKLIGLRDMLIRIYINGWPWSNENSKILIVFGYGYEGRLGKQQRHYRRTEDTCQIKVRGGGSKYMDIKVGAVSNVDGDTVESNISVTDNTFSISIPAHGNDLSFDMVISIMEISEAIRFTKTDLMVCTATISVICIITAVRTYMARRRIHDLRSYIE